MDLAAIPTRTGHQRVLALSGSLRAGSSNTRLLEAAAALVPEGMRLRLYDGIGALPHFNPDLDRDDLRPAPVRAFRAEIAVADALLISCPEYAHGVPGAFKNALDWLVSGPEFPAILVALLSPTPYSTHASTSLQETLRTMSAELLPQASRVIPLPRGPLAPADIRSDPAITAALEAMLATLGTEIARARLEARRLVSAAPFSEPSPAG